MERTGKTYVIVTDDGPNNKDVFLSWTNEDGGYYTTVDDIQDVNVFDFHASVEAATDRANDANSGTLFGWPAPMKIMELHNFNEAYFDGAYPELTTVTTITF